MSSFSLAAAVLVFVLLQPHVWLAFGPLALAVALGLALVAMIGGVGVDVQSFAEQVAAASLQDVTGDIALGVVFGLTTGALASLFAYGLQTAAAIYDEAGFGSPLTQQVFALFVLCMGFAAGTHHVWFLHMREALLGIQMLVLARSWLFVQPTTVAETMAHAFSAAVAWASPALVGALAVGGVGVALGTRTSVVDLRGLQALRWPLALLTLVFSWRTYPESWAQAAFYWPTAAHN